jgi:hypothetical protein
VRSLQQLCRLQSHPVFRDNEGRSNPILPLFCLARRDQHQCMRFARVYTAKGHAEGVVQPLGGAAAAFPGRSSLHTGRQRHNYEL